MLQNADNYAKSPDKQNDPELKKEDQMKNHVRYLKKKESGQRLLISEMSERAKRVQPKNGKDIKRVRGQRRG